MNDELRYLYQELVIDHSRQPRTFRKVEGATCTAAGSNSLCGDQLTLYVKLAGGVIEDIGFQGSGCAVSKASASLMTAALELQLQTDRNARGGSQELRPSGQPRWFRAPSRKSRSPSGSKKRSTSSSASSFDRQR